MRLAVLVLAAALFLQAQPRLQNAKLETRALAGTLDSELRKWRTEAGPVWVAWSVPSAAPERNSCCWYSDHDSSWRGCALEQTYGDRKVGNSGPVSLEPARDIHVLLRFENGRPDKLRHFSADCELDAVNTRFVWLTGVKPSDSIAALSLYLSPNESEGGLRRALNTIALHADPAADVILERHAQPSQPENIRRDAANLIGSVRGARGFDFVSRLAKDDAGERVRRSALRGLANNSDPRAIPYVLDAARNDKNPRIRASLMEIAARKGSKDILQNAMANDPNPEVKKHAVEALAQLPGNEGVPMLIQVAKSNPSSELRKRAMSRLSKSRDPRAQEFVVEILSK